ncbi:unnamed protein product [Urochloa decumbens]|uniref:F-box domain-containing protein n=1 Tax=Urochloa decumbens TaxID=240449 RepID=A0ABC9G147_9POAL
MEHEHHLPEDTVAEILLLLPAKAVARCAAVCKAWRRITADPHFLAARARRRPHPASILLLTYVDASFGAEDIAVDALPISSDDDARHRLIRYPTAAPPLATTRQRCLLLLASCDGVLLFKADAGVYFLFHPVTRQWAQLPRLPADGYYTTYKYDYPELALYFHEPSGEFRLLCFSLQRRVCYIVSTGAAEPRDLLEPEDVTTTGRHITARLFVTPPVPLHGSLHWPPASTTGETALTAFDTVSETFGQMPGPPSRRPWTVKLFEMGGLLAAADFGGNKHVDLCFLEDYSAAGRWARRHRVASPWQHGRGWPHDIDVCSMAVAGDDDGNVILGNNERLLAYDTRSNTVRNVHSVMRRRRSVCVTKLVFKGSPVVRGQHQHACFATLPASSSADFPSIHSRS